MKRVLINLLVCMPALLLMQCGSTANNTSNNVKYASGHEFETLELVLEWPMVEEYINRFGKEYAIVDENDFFKCKNNSIVKLKDYTLYFSPDAEKELRIYVFGEKIEKNKYLLEIKMLNYLGGKQYFNAIIVKEKGGLVLKQIEHYEI